MIKEIQVYEHKATGTYYAQCRSTRFGPCTQWAETADEATRKLKTFVSVHWLEEWPEVERVECQMQKNKKVGAHWREKKLTTSTVLCVKNGTGIT